MKKLILILIFLINIFPKIQNSEITFTSLSAVHAQRSFIPCPDPSDPTPGLLSKILTFFHDFWEWFTGLFEGNGKTVEQKTKETLLQNDVGEGFGSLSLVNYAGFDWGISSGINGSTMYYLPPAENGLTGIQLSLMSRLGYYISEYEFLYDGMFGGNTEAGFNVTFNGGELTIFNGGKINLPQHVQSSVDMVLHYEGPIIHDPNQPSDFFVDENNPLPHGSYKWYKNGVLISELTQASVNSSPGLSNVQVKKTDGETVFEFNLEIYKSAITPATPGTLRTFVSPSGTPITLPPGSNLIYYPKTNNEAVFTNGALFGFEDGNGNEFIFTENNLYSNRSSSSPKYKGLYQVKKDANNNRYISNDTCSTITYPPIVNGKTQVIRVRFVNENGICKLVQELVNYTVGAGTPRVVIRNEVLEQNDDIEDAELISVLSSQIIKCPDGTNNASDPTLLNQYFTGNAQKLKSFLSQSTKNSTKYYLFDCASGKVVHTIDKDNATTLTQAQQDAETAKFNSQNFTEDVAIKGCIENGKWKYETKFNKSIEDHPHAKVGQLLQQVKDEIKNQVDDEVKKLRTPEQMNGGENMQVDNGERFQKKSMDFLETIAAFYDIGKDVISNGVMPEKTWDDGERTGPQDLNAKAEYDKSPLKAPPLIMGTVDQLVDEITGIVQLTKTGFEILRHPTESAKGLWNSVKSLNGDKLKQMVSSTLGITEYTAGGDRAWHQGGMDGVKGAMMIIGTVKFLTKGKEVLDGAGKGMTDVQKFIPDGTTGHPSANALKNATDNGKVVKKIDDDKMLTKNVDGNQESVVVIDKNGEVYKGNATHNIDGVNDDVLKSADPDDIVEMHTDPVINNEVKTQPQQFIDGKAFEKNITNNPNHISEVEAKTNINLSNSISQSQVRIVLSDGSVVVTDNLWVKKVVVNGQTKFEVVINESKLSGSAPFSTNQQKLIQELTSNPPVVNFTLGTSKFGDAFPKGSQFEVKSFVKTVGNGSTNPANSNVTKIF